MINYQYYHTGREYKVHLNLDNGDAQYAKYEGIFERLRTSIDGDVFTYAPTSDGSWIMLQSVQQNVNYAEGFTSALNSLDTYPSKYVGRLAYSPYDGQSFISPDVMLPGADRGYDYPGIARELAPFFGQLVDALIYGDPNKQVVISTPLEKAHDYIKVLGMLFPLEFMKRVGFSLGCKRVPETKYMFYNSDGSNTEVLLRVAISDLSQFDFDILTSGSYVFDAFSGRNNYQTELSAIGAQIALAAPEDYSKWADVIARSTGADGTIDLNRLDALTAQAIFSNAKSKENARRVINKIGYSLGEYEYEAREAVAVLLEETDEACEPNDVLLVNSVRSADAKIAKATEGSYRSYLCRRFGDLNDTTKAQLADFLVNDPSGEGFSYFVDQIRDTASEDDYSAFNFMYSLFDRLFRENKINAYNEWCRKAIEYLDIQNWFGRWTAQEQHSGERFFAILAKEENLNTVCYVAAMLLCTAYTRNCASSDRAVRIAGLRNLLDTRYSHRDAKEKIFCVANIRILMLRFDALRLIEDFDSRFNFVYDIDSGERWMRDNINSISFDSKMDMYLDFIQGRNAAYPYESLRNDLKSHLLNYDEVRTNIVAGENSERKYGTVFESLSPNERYAASKIDAFLRQLKDEAVVNNEFIKLRQDYILDAYSTLSPSTKKKHLKKDEDDYLFAETTLEEQSRLAKLVDNVISVNPSKPLTFWEKVKLFIKDNKLVFISAAVAAIVSVLVLLLLPLTQALLIGDMGVFGAKLALVPKWTWIFPVAVAIMNGIFYSTLCRDAFRRSIKYTLLCGILPEFVFVAFDVIFYCVGLMLF